MAAGFILVVHRCGGPDFMSCRFVAYRPREDNARRGENDSSPFLPLRVRPRDFSLRSKKPASSKQAKPVYADVFPVVAKSNRALLFWWQRDSASWLEATIGKFTAMIILHSHLQPQFKNELFHILHINRKFVCLRSLPNIVNKELNKLKQNSEVQCVH